MKTQEVVHKIMTNKFEDAMIKRSAHALARMMQNMDHRFMLLASIAEKNPRIMAWLDETKDRCDRIAEEI